MLAQPSTRAAASVGGGRSSRRSRRAPSSTEQSAGRRTGRRPATPATALSGDCAPQAPGALVPSLFSSSGARRMAPHPRNRWRPGPEILFVTTITLLFVIAQPADQWIFHHFTYPGIYEHGWGRLLRVAGYVPLWGLIALALVLHAWVPRLRPPPLLPTQRWLPPFWSPPLRRPPPALPH